MCIVSSSGFGGSVTSTLQRTIRVPWLVMCAKLPSVSAFLHELQRLFDFRTEIAWGFEKAQRGVRETLPSHFLWEVMKGALSWSCCPRTRVTASHFMAARPSRFQLLGDGALVTAGFIFGEAAEVVASGVDCDKGDTCRRNHRLSPHAPMKCFRQMSVTELTSTAWCQRDIKLEMSMLHHFLKFPTGRCYDRYPSVDWTLVETGPWPGPTSGVFWFHT